MALGLVVALGTGLLALVDGLTRKRIAAQERRVMLEQLDEIVDRSRYDNALHEDRITVRDESAFPGGQSVTAYRARHVGEPVAIVFRLAAPDGYNGSIRLLVGIDFDGTVSGVRVTGHNETPGLGDAVETGKSDWILGFTGRSPDDPPLERWTVRKDGGAFDQFSGATITPRAIVAAVRRTLEFFLDNRAKLFERPAEELVEARS